MDQEIIPWSEAMKIPSPGWILSIFWQIMIYFWKGEMNNEFYAAHRFPLSVSDIHLCVDHRFHAKTRYHVFQMGDESTGILDESPFLIHYPFFANISFSTLYLEHGDYRHAFQIFIRSFLKRIKRYCSCYPEVDRIYKVLIKLKIISWRCQVCKIFNIWSRQFIEDQLIQHHLSIAPSTLLFLLSYENTMLKTCDDDNDTTDPRELLDILDTCLSRFFKAFEPIYESTSIDILVILKNLIDILLHHSKGRTLEDIPLYERMVCKEMKDYLYHQFKFIQNLSMSNIPRDLMIARDIFANIVHQWNRQRTDRDRTFSPGIVILLNYLLFKDEALEMKNKDKLIVLYRNFNSMTSEIIRPMTPPESDDFNEYHPLLRSFLFLSSSAESHS